MDFIGVGGFALSIVGVGLSIAALLKADGAMKAVDKAIEKGGEQSIRDDARELLGKLNLARDAAMARRQGSHPLASAGRTEHEDIKALQHAQNALATAITSDTSLEAGLRATANELDRALKAINLKTGRDGWADALSAIQGITPKIDQWQRGLGAKALRKDR